jgi:selenocysteine lyase/cysteine desulfurase
MQMLLHVRSIDYDLNAVRISTHYYNSKAEVERLVEGLQDMSQ